MIEDRLYGVRQVYESSPLWLRRLAGVAFTSLPVRLRYGPVYGEIRGLLRETRRASTAELRRVGDGLLEAAVRDAYTHVPLYRRIMDERGLLPRHVRRVGDLRHLPLLDKDVLRATPDELTSRRIAPEHRIYMTTGGSTGEPVGFDLHKGVCRPKEAAFLDHVWSIVGYRRRDRQAIVRGSVLGKDRVWDEDPIKRSLVLSSYHLTEEHIPEMVARLREFAPRYIHAYPSSAALLARHMLASGAPPPPGVRSLLLSSETLREDQRALLSEAFRCRVHAWYGHAERVVFASACELGRGYHVYPEYGALELVDSKGESVPWEPGAQGEIVGSAVWNRAMPLLRYRTYDVATVAEEPCPCSRPHPLLASVEGRAQEFLVADGGRPISTTALNMHSSVFDRVAQIQFHQSVEGEVELRCIPLPGYGPEDERAIRREVGKKLGRSTKLRVVIVDEIQTTLSGKRPLVVQGLSPESVLRGAVARPEPVESRE